MTGESSTEIPSGVEASEEKVDDYGEEGDVVGELSSPSRLSFSHKGRTKSRRVSELICDFDAFEDLGYEPMDVRRPSLRTMKSIAQRNSCSELMENGPSDFLSNAMSSPGSIDHAARHATQNRRYQRRQAIVDDPFEVSYRPGAFLLYDSPKQRQRWGQKQILPRVNWGDLFFDLFYVAAAYNASNILAEDPSGKGCLYFIGTFMAVQQVWILKMNFDARFVVEDDLFHRIFEVLSLSALASAIVHIRPVGILSHPEENIDMFGLSCSMAVHTFLHAFRVLEVALWGKGERELLFNSNIKDVFLLAVCGAVELSAAVISGREYFENNPIGHSEDSHSGGYGTDDHRRFLAGDDYAEATPTLKEANDAPIWLILSVPVFFWLFYAARILICFPSDGSHTKFIVPMNINFGIHRYGEWTMLMLGESIMSLLIVDVPEENTEYFATFYCGLLTVVFLQYLHFRSMPHHADEHVLRLNKNRGMVWKVFHMSYSCALVALGAAFTLMVLSFANSGSSDYNDYDKYGNETDTYNDDHYYGNQTDDHRMLFSSRSLAAATNTRYAPEDMEIRAANMFCVALAITFFCLDGMSIMHVGFKHCEQRCYCKKKKQVNLMGTSLVLVRTGLIVFAATLSQWTTSPETLAGTGLVVAVLQIALRALGDRYLSKKSEHIDCTDDGSESDGMRLPPIEDNEEEEEDAEDK